MCRRQFFHRAVAFKSRAAVAVMMAVIFASVASGQEQVTTARSATLNWQSPAVRQTAGYRQAAPAAAQQVGQSRPAANRIAMTEGQIVMDGGTMVFEEGGEYAGPDGISGGVMTEPCTSCRTPPWHGSVAPPICYGPGQCGPGQCGPVCDPCQPCDPCDRPYRRSCFPRLQALFGEGYLASPMPPCEPRCRHCGAPVPVGF